MQRAQADTARLGLPQGWAAYRPMTTDPGALQVISDPVQLAALAPEWDALAARLDALPFLRPDFISTWLDHFAADARLRILTRRDAGGRLDAVLPLVLQSTRLHGVPMRELCGAANVHSCRFDMLAEHPADAARGFLRLLCNQADWDVLRLPDVPDGAAAHALLDEAAREQLPIGGYASLDSPYIPLPSCWSEFERGLSSKFRANLRRRRRRLAEHGEIRIERISGGADLLTRLDEGLLLEASGWKGRSGTAICQDPATLGFYTVLARRAAAEGRLALWFLRVDGRAVAFHFALEHRGRYLLLKPAYDESLSECSPGQLLTEDVLRDCIGRGLVEFDFLGPNMTWKRDWTPHSRGHQWLYVFRGTRGRLAHSLKFRIGRLAKAMVTRWKR